MVTKFDSQNEKMSSIQEEVRTANVQLAQVLAELKESRKATHNE